MHRLAWLLVVLAGCDSSFTFPKPRPLGAKHLPGYELLSGHTLGYDTRYVGYLVTSDKPGHVTIAWIDHSSGGDVFDGTIAADAPFDPAGTFAHTGDEALAFDSPAQLSFHSTPGARLLGVDVAAPSGVIYLDARINQAHDGATIDFNTLVDPDFPSDDSWSSQVDPVAFATE